MSEDQQEELLGGLEALKEATQIKHWSDLRPDSFPVHPKALTSEHFKSLLPPIPWHEKLALLFKNTPADTYRRGHEALLRLLALNHGNQDILPVPSLIQPYPDLLDGVLYPRDLIGVTTVFQEGPNAYALLLVENRSPSHQARQEESVGKTTIAERLVGLAPTDATLVQRLGIDYGINSDELLTKLDAVAALSIPEPQIITGGKLLTGNMTYIGLNEGDGCLVALAPVGQQEDWDWDLSRSLIRRTCESYDRYQMRNLQISLAEKLRIPKNVLASNHHLYPIRWVVIIQREGFGEQEVSVQGGEEVSKPERVAEILSEQLEGNPGYHTSGHWAGNKKEYDRRANQLTNSRHLRQPPERLSFLHVRKTQRFFPVDEITRAILDKSALQP